jgi:hypothetical protein
MKFIRKYNHFIIKESFSKSIEYTDLVNKISIDKSFFLDNLNEISDIYNADVKFYKYISNKKGHMLNTELEEGETYLIKYVIIITYPISNRGQDINYEEWSKKLDNLNTIKLCIDEMIDRCSEKVKLSHNNTTIGSSTNSDSRLVHIIHFDSDPLEVSDIKKAFDAWNSDKGPEFEKMMDKLRGIYKSRNIDFDMYMDTSDADDYILIGVFPPDEELYGVAEFNKSTKKWNIDMTEVTSSFRGFDEQD